MSHPITIYASEFSLSAQDYEFTYQKELTRKLDSIGDDFFNQQLINEIILWKVNRYALLSDQTLSLVNQIDSTGSDIDLAKTHTVLAALLKSKGGTASNGIRYPALS
ncbi:hypothetical protein [Xanthocytophaga agilis]|uniref:Uncharacterized protein n=1 Tax=Xanthocytophaga agilis TaxID=3048010 RepID=A0AAE3UID2_9BACT|nr:hypothetical protein [Xanthocytophaga agilis]MDJ1505246.1 hypothetical protein [Xanthocytophaga agilis]